MILFLFSFLSSSAWVKIKLKLPHFHVSDTCVELVQSRWRRNNDHGALPWPRTIYAEIMKLGAFFTQEKLIMLGIEPTYTMLNL